jgi:hypothetical protein
MVLQKPMNLRPRKSNIVTPTFFPHENEISAPHNLQFAVQQSAMLSRRDGIQPERCFPHRFGPVFNPFTHPF